METPPSPHTSGICKGAPLVTHSLPGLASLWIPSLLWILWGLFPEASLWRTIVMEWRNACPTPLPNYNLSLNQLPITFYDKGQLGLL